MRWVDEKREILLPYKLLDWGDVSEKVRSVTDDLKTDELEENGIGVFLKVDRAMDGIIVNYRVIKDDGNFINFGGLSVNTESGFACMGYNADNNYYVPLISVVDVFNSKYLVGEDKKYDLDDILYVLDEFKRDYRGIDVVKHLKDLDKDKKFMSSSINIIKKELLMGDGENSIEVMENGDLFVLLGSIFCMITERVDCLGEIFFWRYIVGDGSLREKENDKRVEYLYAREILTGIDADFLMELSSCGVGINRRVGRKRGNETYLGMMLDDAVKMFAYMSSWAYYDEFEEKKIGAVREEKIRSYNICDLVRAAGMDMELMFCVGVYVESRKPFEVLMDKLELLREVDKIGRDKFIEYAANYFKSIATMEMGGAYSRKVKPVQSGLPLVGEKSFIGAGKSLNKIRKRLDRCMVDKE